MATDYSLSSLSENNLYLFISNDFQYNYIWVEYTDRYVKFKWALLKTKSLLTEHKLLQICRMVCLNNIIGTASYNAPRQSKLNGLKIFQSDDRLGKFIPYLINY